MGLKIAGELIWKSFSPKSKPSNLVGFGLFVDFQKFLRVKWKFTRFPSC